MSFNPSWLSVWALIGVLLHWVTLSAAHSSNPYSHDHSHEYQHRAIDHSLALNNDTIPLATREYWMRYAIELLAERAPPCTVNMFGAAVVNHTDSSSLGSLVCDGINKGSNRGDPTLHGEMVAIHQCYDVLQKPPYSLSSAAASAALRDLTLYTTAEPCPMCSSAIRWGAFRECVYGTSIDTLISMGWTQIAVSSAEIFERSHGLNTFTALFEGILRNETDPLFSWQFDPKAPCPAGCSRNTKGHCVQEHSDL